MQLEVTGKLIKKLEIQSGTSQHGNWSRQDIVIETIEQYPRKICLSLRGERIKDAEMMQIGDTISASINIESREYNGKWYTSVNAWRLHKGDESAQSQQPQQPSYQASQPAATKSPSIDDLPPIDGADATSMDSNGGISDLPF